MTKITNKPDFTEFKKHMITAAKELGVEMEFTGITYGNENFSIRAQCFNGDAGRREEFARVAQMKGNFPASWYGGVFEVKGRKLKITGAKSRGRKNTLVFTNEENGEETIGSPAFVRSGRPITDNVKPVNALVQEGGVLV